MIIYKALNKINNKVYIGQTVRSLEERMKGHKNASLDSDRKQYFYNAIRQHGWDNFEWSILKECSSIEELNESEKYFVKEFNSNNTDFGYNMTDGGDNGLHVQETKDIISEKLKKPKSKEHIESLKKEAQRRKEEGVGFFSEEARQNQIKNTPRGEEHPLFGTVRPDSVKQAISEKKTGVSNGPCTPERAAAISKGKTGKKREPFSEEWKQKIGESLKEHYQNNEPKEWTDERRKKASEGAKNRDDNTRFRKVPKSEYANILELLAVKGATKRSVHKQYVEKGFDISFSGFKKILRRARANNENNGSTQVETNILYNEDQNDKTDESTRSSTL